MAAITRSRLFEKPYALPQPRFFELRSTGGPGERLLYVTVGEEDERAAKTPARERFGFDWASYRWHLKPD